MALVQFGGTLVPKLGEKPQMLPRSPAVARATCADPRFLASKNGYVRAQLACDSIACSTTRKCMMESVVYTRLCCHKILFLSSTTDITFYL